MYWVRTWCALGSSLPSVSCFLHRESRHYFARVLFGVFAVYSIFFLLNSENLPKKGIHKTYFGCQNEPQIGPFQQREEFFSPFKLIADVKAPQARALWWPATSFQPLSQIKRFRESDMLIARLMVRVLSLFCQDWWSDLDKYLALAERIFWQY